MVALDPKTLATMRAAVQAYMLDTAGIYTVTRTRDRYGAASETYTPVSAAIACQTRQPNASETKYIDAQRDQGILGTETMAIVFPHGTPLTDQHRLKTSDNRYWRVLRVNLTPTLAAAVEAVITLDTMRDA